MDCIALDTHITVGGGEPDVLARAVSWWSDLIIVNFLRLRRATIKKMQFQPLEDSNGKTTTDIGN
jgi:hypothetical protein